MGVAGSGKSTLARALAAALARPLVEADDHHDAAARARMSRGEGLDDALRAPWLDRVSGAARTAGPCVIACSALKRSYRERLAPDATICLVLDEAAATARLAARHRAASGHFAGPALAASQFRDLELPEPSEDVLLLPAAQSPEVILKQALDWLIRPAAVLG